MRVVIGEDQQVFARALAEALRARGVDVVGLARTLPDILRVVDETAPDVAILDIELPPDFTDEGIHAAEQIRSNRPEVGVLVLSQYGEVAYAERILSAGARAVGYLLKQRVDDIGTLVQAIGRIAAGELVLDPLIVERLLSRRRVHNPLDDLTPQERRVLVLMAEGYSDRGIADRLRCKPKTVERHVSAIVHKLQLPSVEEEHRSAVNVRVLAVLAYLRRGRASRGAGGRER
jgi:DNA-binding NarL/FixJ family response regulator